MPDRRQSAVFFPIAVAGGVSGTRKSRDARPNSDSAETSSPGANEPPRKSPSALTTSKFVVVPKSTTIAGPPYRRCAASVFAIRSAPTSDGLSTRRRTPVLMPGPTMKAARSRYRSASRVNDCVSGGTTLTSKSASISSSARSSCASRPSSITASSSSVRSWTVTRRQVRISRSLSYAPMTMFVLPTSIARTALMSIVRFGGAGAQASLPQVRLQRLRDVRRYELGDRRPEGDELLHTRSGKEQIVRSGHEIDHLDLRRELAVHVAHLEFELEVRQRAEPADDEARADLFRERHLQTVERADLDVGARSAGLAHERDALIGVEQRLLREVPADADDHAVEKARGTFDDVEMPVGGRIERAGIDGHPITHTG